MEEAGVHRVTATVHNGNDTAPLSSHGDCPIMIQVAWLDRHDRPIALPATLSALSHAIPPNDARVVDLDVTAIDAIGRFEAEVALVQKVGNAWRRQTAPGARIRYDVTARPVDNMDYLALYGTVNLDANHWAIVGPQVKTEYDRLGAVKLQQLIEAGLTRDSALIDIGCGTGLLTGALETYLSDDGLYVGTDIAHQAIDFCIQRYTRPNFRFAVNTMTEIPVSGESFDAACLFSVLTHTYPDETVLLLAEVKRLLKPGGFVIADVFESPMVERWAGHRGALEYETDHLVGLIAAVGLQPELLSSTPWKRFGARRYWRLTHR